MIKDLKINIFLKLGAFYLFAWAIHIVLVSIVSFFHFRLDHRLMVIENWIYDFSWLAFFISKTIAIFLYLKYFSSERVEGRFVKNILTSFSRLDGIFYLIPLVSMIFLMFFIQPEQKLNSNFEISRSIFHAISILFIFGVDLVFLKTINTFKDGINWIEVLVCSFMSLLFFKLSMPYSNMELFFFNINFIIFTFFYFSKELSFPMSFVAFVVVPLYTLLGFDPIWGGDYSFFTSELTSLNIHTSAIIIALITFYLIENKKESAS